MTAKKPTLYITFDGLSDPLGQSQILPYLCGIADNGYEITILSCEKKDRLEKEKENISRRLKKHGIQWDYILYDTSGGFTTRLSYVFKLYARAKKIYHTQHIKLVHCRSYLASLIGLRLKKKYQLPFLFDMRGFWADERIDGNIWSKKRFLHRVFYSYFKSKENDFLENSDAIVSLTHAGIDELVKLHPELKLRQKTTVIPCSTDTHLFHRTENAPIAINGILPGDHVFIYSGSIGTWYYTREMIDCMMVWKDLIPQLKLLIVTRDTEALEEIVATYPEQTKNMIVAQSASYQQMPAFLSLADASVFFIKPAYSKIASSPTKMSECWAMDLPIITNAGIGDNDLYFKQHKGGILIDAFDENSYRKAAQQYLELNKTGLSYRGLALNYFDSKLAVKKYTDIYNLLTDK